MIMNDNKVTTKRSAAHADAAHRAERAWSARVIGASWHEAAEVAGFTDAANCLRAVRNYFGKLPEPDRDHLRDMWRERLEHLWRQAIADVQEQKPGAVRAAVALAQRASAMDGLDAPAQVTVHAPTDQQIEQYVTQLLALGATRRDAEEADILD